MELWKITTIHLYPEPSNDKPVSVIKQSNGHRRKKVVFLTPRLASRVFRLELESMGLVGTNCEMGHRHPNTVLQLQGLLMQQEHQIDIKKKVLSKWHGDYSWGVHWQIQCCQFVFPQRERTQERMGSKKVSPGSLREYFVSDNTATHYAHTWWNYYVSQRFIDFCALFLHVEYCGTSVQQLVALR